MDSIIDIKNVFFRYKGSDNGLLNDFSLSVKRGEVLLLCGLSGSEKTTVIRLINGLIPQESEKSVLFCRYRWRDRIRS